MKNKTKQAINTITAKKHNTTTRDACAVTADYKLLTVHELVWVNHLWMSMCWKNITRRRQHFLAINAWLLVCTDSLIGTHPLDSNDLANESIFCPVSTLFGNWLLYARFLPSINVGVVWKKFHIFNLQNVNKKKERKKSGTSVFRYYRKEHSLVVCVKMELDNTENSMWLFSDYERNLWKFVSKLCTLLVVKN